MELITPKDRPELQENEKLNERYMRFKKLIEELRKRELPLAIRSSVNIEVEILNTVPSLKKEFSLKLHKCQSNILQLIEKELNLVHKKHYLKLWTGLGVAVFGIPLGVVFGLSLGNLALMGVGLPMGIAFGTAFGAALDKKAAEEGRQLDVEL